MIYGKWTECLWGIDPAAYESFKKRERRGDQLSKSQPVRHCSPRDDGPGVGAGGARGRASSCGSECWESAFPCWLRERETACLDAAWGSGLSACRVCITAEAAVVSRGGVPWCCHVPPSPSEPTCTCISLGTLCSGCFLTHLRSSCLVCLDPAQKSRECHVECQVTDSTVENFWQAPLEVWNSDYPRASFLELQTRSGSSKEVSDFSR